MSQWPVFFEFVERRARSLEGPVRADPAQQECARRLLTDGWLNPEAMDPRVRAVARRFRQGLRPTRNFKARLQADLARFVELAPLLFEPVEEHRDLLALNEAVKLFNRYDRPEEAFVFLHGLKAVAPPPISPRLNGEAFQRLTRAVTAAHHRFFFDLRVECRLTTRALTDDAARQLAQELGEVELTLRARIVDLEGQVLRLTQELEWTREQGAEAGLRHLALKLQNRPQPILNQLDGVCRRLQRLEHPDPDQLSILIALEETLGALAELGLERFPPPGTATFTLTCDELADHHYQYVAGRPWSDDDQRQVYCLAPGWRVGGSLVTPAQVAEHEEGVHQA